MMRAGVMFAAAVVAGVAQGQQPSVANARFETRAYSGDLQSEIRAATPAWFGYVVKTARRDGRNCCWNNGEACGCRLEGQTGVTVAGGVSTNQPIELEGSDQLAVLFRVDHGQVEKVRAFSLSCALDAGGLPFVWISGVPEAASVAYVDGLIDRGDGNRVTDGALFALSQHQDGEATTRLIRRAERDPSPHLRGQALFWLAQRAGDRASATITDAILNDPNTEVKRRAVFALSQLPAHESIPKLIELARTQRNPEVRKQAFFWLGQSRDPRALAYIESVLIR